MPRITRIELPDQMTVEEQLHSAAVDLLPEWMSDDPLVEWVMSYDALNRDMNEGNTVDEIFGPECRWGNGWEVVMCSLITSILQTKAPYYFAAIFHIGRMQQVSHFALEMNSIIADRSGFQSSVLELAERLGGQDQIQRAESIIQKLTTASTQYYRRQIDLADQWWQLWRREVEVLYNLVLTFRRARQEMDRTLPGALVRLIVEANMPSYLLSSMAAEGVRFKSESTSSLAPISQPFTNLSWMFPLILATATYDHRDPDFARHELRNLWQDIMDTERRRSIEPQVQIALRQLEEQYGGKSPFDEFAVLRRPAMLELRQLVQENKLPGNTDSPWLEIWRGSLEEMPWFSEHLLKPTNEAESIQTALRLADSEIKRNIAERIFPTESWNDFIQRLFETEWVEDFGRMAGATNRKAGKQNSVWNLSDFSSFIDKVVQGLNAYGYVLHTPAERRLQILLDKVFQGESFYHNW